MTKKQYRNGVFISYSHRDKEWLEKLQIVLKPFTRNESIELWDDTRIPVGASWETEIEKAISSSRVAVLLVSANFLASDFIASKELPKILSAQKRGLVIFWIPVSAAAFKQTELAKFQAASDPSKPLDSLPNSEQQKVLVQIAERIAAGMQANAMANIFSIVDEFSSQQEAFVRGEKVTARGIPHGITALQQEDSVRFEAEEGTVEIITADDLKKLDPRSQQLIRSYEFAMQDLFDRWTELEPKRVARDPVLRKDAFRESEEVRQDLCKQLNKILNFVAFMGKQLHDHYHSVRFICEESPDLDLAEE